MQGSGTSKGASISVAAGSRGGFAVIPGVSRSSQSINFQSETSKKLALLPPPPAKTEFTSWFWGVMLISIGFIVAVSGGWSPIVLIFFVLCLVGGITALKAANKDKGRYDIELQKTQAAYQKSISIWNQLYYCSRDDVVFYPGKGDSAPVHQMLDYINHHVSQPDLITLPTTIA